MARVENKESLQITGIGKNFLKWAPVAQEVTTRTDKKKVVWGE